MHRTLYTMAQSPSVYHVSVVEMAEAIVQEFAETV